MCKILFAVQDLHFFQKAKKEFEKIQYNLIPLTDGKRIYEVFEANGCVGLVVCSEMVPSENGAFFDGICRKGLVQKAPVIVVMAQKNCQKRVNFLRSGAADVLEPPFEVEELTIRMERHIKNLHIQEGVEGFLDAYPLADLFQNFQASRQSGTLEVFSEGQSGVVVFQNGDIMKAQFEGWKGSEAFWGLLELSNGAFRFLPSSNISLLSEGRPLNLNHLLLRAAWIEDQLKRLEPFRIEAKQLMKRTGKATRLEASDELILLERVLAAFDINAHHAKCHLLEAHIASPGRIDFAMRWLLENGYLAFAG